jgi:hypothetical protein
MNTLPANGIRTHHDVRAGTYLFFFFTFAILIYLAHWHYLKLPFFWDELGQFVPAALDILHDNAWIPRSTTPNIHPPGVMAYLAGIWRVFGFSILTTRLAMLLLAAFGLLFTFLLTVRLAEGLPGIPALFAVLLLLCDPLFYTQAMMAQLDMPAMVFCLIALVLFFEERHRAAAMACTAAVLSKETAVLLPLVFAAVLFREKRLRQNGLFYAIPFFALITWLLALRSVTGTAFGNEGFEHYNIGYALNPVRAVFSLLRRLYYLFVDDFRWVGTVTIFLSWRRYRIYATRPWRITMIFAAAHIALVSLLGGAELERYLLPVLPIFYIAVAAALSTVPQVLLRNVGMFALCGGLITGLFVNPVFPFPYEDNLSMADFVQLHQTAAQYLESHFKDRTIYTAWPLTPALQRTEFGYVQHPLKTHETGDLRYSTLAKLDPKSVDVLVLYSRTWSPQGWSVLRIAGVGHLLENYYDYEPQMTEEQCRSVLGLVRVARWDQRGQWVAVYAKPM